MLRATAVAVCLAAAAAHFAWEHDVAEVHLLEPASLATPVLTLGQHARYVKKEDGVVETHLTEALNDLSGRLIVDTRGQANEITRVSFDYYCGDTTDETETAADGFSLSLGNATTLTGEVELGTEKGLVVSFVEYPYNTHNLFGLSVFYDRGDADKNKQGAPYAPVAGPTGDASIFCAGQWVTVEIEICPLGHRPDATKVAVAVDGAVVLDVDVDDLDLTGHDVVLAARTGTANANHWVKHVSYVADISLCPSIRPFPSPLLTFA